VNEALLEGLAAHSEEDQLKVAIALEVALSEALKCT
jgi:hypothetical protein